MVRSNTTPQEHQDGVADDADDDRMHNMRQGHGDLADAERLIQIPVTSVSVLNRTGPGNDSGCLPPWARRAAQRAAANVKDGGVEEATKHFPGVMLLAAMMLGDQRRVNKVAEFVRMHENEAAIRLAVLWLEDSSSKASKTMHHQQQQHRDGGVPADSVATLATLCTQRVSSGNVHEIRIGRVIVGAALQHLNTVAAGKGSLHEGVAKIVVNGAPLASLEALHKLSVVVAMEKNLADIRGGAPPALLGGVCRALMRSGALASSRPCDLERALAPLSCVAFATARAATRRSASTTSTTARSRTAVSILSRRADALARAELEVRGIFEHKIKADEDMASSRKQYAKMSRGEASASYKSWPWLRGKEYLPCVADALTYSTPTRTPTMTSRSTGREIDTLSSTSQVSVRTRRLLRLLALIDDLDRAEGSCSSNSDRDGIMDVEGLAGVVMSDLSVESSLASTNGDDVDDVVWQAAIGDMLVRALCQIEARTILEKWGGDARGSTYKEQDEKEADEFKPGHPRPLPWRIIQHATLQAIECEIIAVEGAIGQDQQRNLRGSLAANRLADVVFPAVLRSMRYEIATAFAVTTLQMLCRVSSDCALLGSPLVMSQRDFIDIVGKDARIWPSLAPLVPRPERRAVALAAIKEHGTPKESDAPRSTASIAGRILFDKLANAAILSLGDDDKNYTVGDNDVEFSNPWSPGKCSEWFVLILQDFAASLCGNVDDVLISLTHLRAALADARFDELMHTNARHYESDGTASMYSNSARAFDRIEAAAESVLSSSVVSAASPIELSYELRRVARDAHLSLNAAKERANTLFRNNDDGGDQNQRPLKRMRDDVISRHLTADVADADADWIIVNASSAEPTFEDALPKDGNVNSISLREHTQWPVPPSQLCCALSNSCAAVRFAAASLCGRFAPPENAIAISPGRAKLLAQAIIDVLVSSSPKAFVVHGIEAAIEALGNLCENYPIAVAPVLLGPIERFCSLRENGGEEIEEYTMLAAETSACCSELLRAVSANSPYAIAGKVKQIRRIAVDLAWRSSATTSFQPTWHRCAAAMLVCARLILPWRPNSYVIAASSGEEADYGEEAIDVDRTRTIRTLKCVVIARGPLSDLLWNELIAFVIEDAPLCFLDTALQSLAGTYLTSTDRAPEGDDDAAICMMRIRTAREMAAAFEER